MSVLREAFIEELKDLFGAENQLHRALPKLAKAAHNSQLRAAFEEHHSQTAKQIWRLGQVFEAFEERARGKRCKGMQGLLQEAQDIIKENEGDAALIAAAQKAEHYEIAVYGTLSSWAVALGQEQVLQLLTETLNEEKETDKKLTGIAQSVVNSQESQRDEDEVQPKPKRRAPQAPRRRSRTPRQSRKSTSRRRTMMNRSSRAPRSKRLRGASAR